MCIFNSSYAQKVIMHRIVLFSSITSYIFGISCEQVGNCTELGMCELWGYQLGWDRLLLIITNNHKNVNHFPSSLSFAIFPKMVNKGLCCLDRVGHHWNPLSWWLCTRRAAAWQTAVGPVSAHRHQHPWSWNERWLWASA